MKNVIETLKCMVRAKILVEVTTLVIPGLNDDPEQLKDLAAFLAESLGVQTPWHVSRFHPTYKVTSHPPTPVSTLLMAYETGKKAGLRYVYTGNIPGRGTENTYCHNCQTLLIERMGFSIIKNIVKNGACPKCNTPVYGIWE